MHKIITLLILSVIFLYGQSEKFYKSKYDYYTKKVQELNDKSWEKYEHSTALSDFKYQFEMAGARNEAKETEEEINEVEEERDKIAERIAEYKDKIMELKFTIEEDLGEIPDWFKQN